MITEQTFHCEVSTGPPYIKVVIDTVTFDNADYINYIALYQNIIQFTTAFGWNIIDLSS